MASLLIVLSRCPGGGRRILKQTRRFREAVSHTADSSRYSGFRSALRHEVQFAGMFPGSCGNVARHGSRRTPGAAGFVLPRQWLQRFAYVGLAVWLASRGMAFQL